MELRQVYEQLNGDYDSVLSRLMTEERIVKYLLKFLDQNMDILILKALETEDYETAFREAHNLKGVCANLNLDRLEVSASALTEALRRGKPEGDISSLVENMKSDYQLTVNALKSLKD
ncbi:MAG: Hpt domain-containing protein [Acetatifactor sp.]